MASKKPGYTIKLASHLTGVPIETLRVWERRYRFPLPSREESGRRLYSDQDIRRVRLIARAVASGFRPSDVIGKAESEVLALLAPEPALAPPRPSEHAHSEELLQALRSLDMALLQKRLRQLALAFGPKGFVTAVAQPLALSVGQAWADGLLGIHHEHLATEVLTTELRVLLATLEPDKARPKILLAALPGEEHTLALELVAVYAAASGAWPHILGRRSPPEDIAAAAEALRVSAVGITLSAPPKESKPAASVAALARCLRKRTTLWIGGRFATSVPKPRGALIVQTWAELAEALLVA